ncbi:hypothetical protein D3C87_1945850 [compost metagenome]
MVVFVGYLIASDLGANSPKTICKTVIIAKATGTAALFAAASEMSRLNASKRFLMSAVITSSPTQPRPSEARVIPNCVAAR